MAPTRLDVARCVCSWGLGIASLFFVVPLTVLAVPQQHVGVLADVGVHVMGCTYWGGTTTPTVRIALVLTNGMHCDSCQVHQDIFFDDADALLFASNANWTQGSPLVYWSAPLTPRVCTLDPDVSGNDLPFIVGCCGITVTVGCVCLGYVLAARMPASFPPRCTLKAVSVAVAPQAAVAQARDAGDDDMMALPLAPVSGAVVAASAKAVPVPCPRSLVRTVYTTSSVVSTRARAATDALWRDRLARAEFPPVAREEVWEDPSDPPLPGRLHMT